MLLIRHGFYRIFQFIFYRAAKLLKWPVPKRIEGEGSVLELPQEVLRRGVKHVLLVTDATIVRLGFAEPLKKALEDAGVRCSVFDTVLPNPTIAIVEAARAAYAADDCDGFVALGGGSVIDTAKVAAARIALPRKSVARMRGFLKVGKTLPPVFAVPTTAGTGSEVTIAAVVTDEHHHKYAVSDPHLIPVCAVLDPAFSARMPSSVTAETGMDALTHAVEAYITKGVSKRCRTLSEKAVKLIFANLPRVYGNGADMEARMNMLRAAFFAGDSFTRAGLTYVHPVAHTLSGLYGTPHGRANAVTLPVVLEAFGRSVEKPLAQLANAAGIDVSGKTDGEAAKAFIAAIRGLNRSMGIPDAFGFIREEDIPQMTAWALAEANPWYPVPMVFGAAEVEAIIRQIIKGE